MGKIKSMIAAILLTVVLTPMAAYGQNAAPKINSVTITGRTPYEYWNDVYLYNDISFAVDYEGSNHIDYSVEQEDGMIIRDYTVNDSPIACGSATHIVTTNYAWVNIKVTNPYGEATYRLEIPPYYVAGVTDISQNTTDYTDVEVYTVTGIKVTAAQSDAGILNGLAKGIYLVRYINGGKTVKIEKKAR